MHAHAWYLSEELFVLVNRDESGVINEAEFADASAIFAAGTSSSCIFQELLPTVEPGLDGHTGRQVDREEWDEHMRTHIPFRRWCPFCVKGKCKINPHVQRAKSCEELEHETPVISFDYMGPKSKDDKGHKIDSLPIIVGSDRKH